MSNDALKNEFLVESFENLSSISEDLTRYEREPENKELLNKIYRSVHTMKGSASFLGYKKLQDVTHASENLLDFIREDKIIINTPIVDCLLEAFDLCAKFLKDIEQNDTEGESEYLAIIDKLNSLVDKENLDSELEQPISKEIKNSELTQNTGLEEELQDELEQEQGSSLMDDQDILDLIEDHEKSAHPELQTSDTQEDIEEPTEEDFESVVEDDIKAEQEKAENIEGLEAQGLSQAALDSLKELVGDGGLDASVLEDLTSSDHKEVADTKQAPSNNVENSSFDKGEDILESVADKDIEAEIKSDTEVVVNTANALESEIIEDKSLEDNRKSIIDSVVRVNVQVLDRIMNLTGELVLNRNQMLQLASQIPGAEINRITQQLNVITSDLQSEVMSTRMQPLASILNKFERLVRDLAKKSGKQIELKLHGQETELDKTLLEAIKDPLVHIIRNASDHGIETPEERKIAGKSAKGILSIKAYNESGQVTIEINDNGRGLNPQKISQKAIEKGIVTAEQVNLMSEGQVFSLIFSPGFSTAEKVTNISGRGVGMDVVKTNIERIGGSVSLSSRIGEGTTFKLRIPLTLAIVPALVVRSNNLSFAIPQINLVELVRLETQIEKKQIEKIQGAEFLRLRDVLTPIFRLDKCLELEETYSNYCRLNKIKREESNDEDSVNIVILKAENSTFGIVVDDVLDTEEIVVKPLESVKNLTIFGGATIMGNGQVSLILDSMGFINKFSQLKTEKVEQQADSSVVRDDFTELQENLLAKLFDGRVYAIPLTLISRLEEFDVIQIEKTGKQPVVRYLEQPMPLIDIDKTLNLSGHDFLHSLNDESKIKCVVISIRNKFFGLIVDEILDISIDQTVIDDSSVDREGILGTIYIKEKTVSVLDIYKIIEMQKFNSSKSIALEKDFQVTSSPKKVLLVDDSSMYRKMEGDAIKELGHNVDFAFNGEMGLAQLEKNEYDLIVTDIEMPVMTGYEFAKQVRANARFDNIKILALSTRSSDEDKKKGRECGFDYHLEKFKKDEVLDQIQTILGDK